MMRYYARSASDKTDDWPFWFVADTSKGGLNVTADLARKIEPETARAGAVFRSQRRAIELAMKANAALTAQERTDDY